jgi:putative transcriptional regulator
MDAKQIKELRASLGLTQEQFARKVGVAYFTVVRWECNMNNPSHLAQEKLELIRKEHNNGKTKIR